MRTLIAVTLLIAGMSGCISDGAEPANSLPAELDAFAVVGVQDQVADWGYAVVDATESGDVSGLAFIITEEAIARAESGSGRIIAQVTPLLPLDVGLEKYLVMAFDTGRNIHHEAGSTVATAEGEIDDAQSTAQAELGKAKLLAGQTFTKLQGQRETLNGAAAVAQAAGSGPVSLDLGAAANFEAGDIIAFTVGLEASADAALGNVHAVAAEVKAQAEAAADDAQAAADDARAEIEQRVADAQALVQGKALILIATVQSAQTALPSDEDVSAVVASLAADGRGVAMQVIGKAQGFAIPVFQMDVQGNVRTILQSADIDATVRSTAGGLWPFLSTETFEIEIVTNTAGGFGGFAGLLSGDLGSLDWDLSANVHGLVAAASESGINAGPSNVGATFDLVASGQGGTDLLFQVETKAKDTAATLQVVGFDLGADLQTLIGQEIEQVNSVSGSGLPIGFVSARDLA